MCISPYGVDKIIFLLQDTLVLSQQGGAMLFETKYGNMEWPVRRLLDAPIYYTLGDQRIPAGHVMRNGKPLKTAIRLRVGTVLAPRRNEKYPRGICWQVFPYGLYEAYRACLHIRDGYENDNMGETHVIGLAQQDITQTLALLARYRQVGTKDRQQIDATIALWADSFKPAVNEVKQEAAEQLEGAADVIDSRGRVNPSMTMARLVAAGHRLIVRLDEIKRIDPRIGSRQIALLLEKQRVHSSLSYAYHVLDQVYGESKDVRHGQWQTRARWVAFVEGVHRELQGTIIGPFKVPVDRLMTECRQVIRLISQHKIPEARQLIGRMRQALRCKKARQKLEDFIFHLEMALQHRTNNERETDQELVGQLQDFLSRFRTIEDNGFVVPVREVVERKLVDAHSAIIHGELAKAKELCRSAARRL